MALLWGCEAPLSSRVQELDLDLGVGADQSEPADAAELGADTCVPGDLAAGGDLGPESAREETDQQGKLWKLEDWPDCTRPYPKALVEREAWYQERWGERWFKEPYRGYLSSPGTWAWEELAVIPHGKVYASNKDSGGKSQAIAYAPGGGEVVSDVYATADYALFHVDPETKTITAIGDPRSRWFSRRTSGARALTSRAKRSNQALWSFAWAAR